jgi:prophage antirepressor-like protein
MTELINQIDMSLSFNDNSIRIVGTPDKPLFVVKDICNILGLSNTTEVIRHLPVNWQSSIQLNSAPGTRAQNMSLVSESGLYKIIMNSRKPIAQPFQEFVCDEILPSIRKTGEYKLQAIIDENKRLEEEKQTLHEEKETLTNEIDQKEEKINSLNKRVDRLKGTKNRKILFRKGKTVYVGRNLIDEGFFKVGITDGPNDRMSTLSCGTTSDFEIEKIWYTRFHKQIEDAVKINFDDDRFSNRKEFYYNEKYDEICNYITEMINAFNKLDTRKEELPYNNNGDIENKELDDSSVESKNPDMLPKKPCKVCKKVLDLDEFFNAKEHVDGKENTCKSCVKIRQQKYVEDKRQNEEMPKTKVCTGCGEVFSLNMYYKDSYKADGHSLKCKECIKKVQSADKNKIDVSEYCCRTCKKTKPLSEFHKLMKSKTGHKYSCKECELYIAKERYNSKRKEEFDKIEINDELEEKIKEEVIDRNEINKDFKISCECGKEIKSYNYRRHIKTKTHLERLK